MASSSTNQSATRRRLDRRASGIILTVLGVILLGWIIQNSDVAPSMVSPQEKLASIKHAESGDRPAIAAREQTPAAPVSQGPKSELRKKLDERYKQAVMMLHAKRYEHALVALDTVLAIDPNLPEAYVNAGFALIGLQRYPEADRAFASAIELRPQLTNAYYGLAIALEGQGQLRPAIGAMRIYTHRADPEDAFFRKAESAIWEWEERLKEAPEVPTDHFTSAGQSAPGQAQGE